MDQFVNNIGTLASIIGSFTVVGSALMWIYNKFIGAPRERKREREESKRHEKMLKLINESNAPLNQSIERLNELLDESQLDRKQLNHTAEKNTFQLEEHEGRLDNHHERLVVLETKNGVKKVVYKEGDEGN